MEFQINSPKYGIKTVLIDDEDYEKVKVYPWHLSYNKFRDAFYIQGSFYKDKKLNQILLHRLIMNYPDGLSVDHVNHNTFDNRKENLRICSNAENSYNQKVRPKNTSGYKGVCWKKNQNKFHAYINKDYKQIHLGYFKNITDAAKAYNKAALEYHGEFAYLNQI